MKHSSSRLIRFIALSDWIVAVLVGVPSAGGLYTIWSGQYRNSNWVDPAMFVHEQEWGLLLSAACITAGMGLWNFHRWSRWFETLLVIPKLYSTYSRLFFAFAITRSWVFLFVFLVVLADAGLVGLLWSARGRAAFGAGSSRKLISAVRLSTEIPGTKS